MGNFLSSLRYLGSIFLPAIRAGRSARGWTAEGLFFAGVVLLISLVIRRKEAIDNLTTWLPTLPAILITFAIFLVIRMVVIAAQSNERQEKKISDLAAYLIPKVRKSLIMFVDPGSHEKSPNGVTTFRVTVKNDGDVKIDEISVRIRTVEPPSDEMNQYRGALLHQKHNNTKPFREDFFLRPGKKQEMDVVAGKDGTASFSVCHIVEGIDQLVLCPLGKRDFVFVVEADSDDASCEIRLVVKVDDNNRLFMR